jgi:hypothetical protein
MKNTNNQSRLITAIIMVASLSCNTKPDHGGDATDTGQTTFPAASIAPDNEDTVPKKNTAPAGKPPEPADTLQGKSYLEPPPH